MDAATQPARKLIHTSLIPIRWGDMDAYGHVNNTVYFRYMEQARVEYLEAHGYKVMPQGTGPVIVSTSCTFLIALGYPGTVELKMFAGTPGRSSFPTYFEFRLQGDERLFATGEAKVVWIEMASGKSIPLPDSLRAKLV